MLKSLRIPAITILFCFFSLVGLGQGSIVDSFDNCAIWTQKSENTQTSTYATDTFCGNSMMSFFTSTTVKKHAYRNYTFTAGNVYVITVAYNAWAFGGQFLQYHLRVFASNGWNNAPTAQAAWMHGTTPTGIFVSKFVFVPSTNYSTLWLRADNTGATIDVDYLQIEENPCNGTSATITGASSICQNTSSTFSATSGQAYFWPFNGSTSQTAIAPTSTPGSQTVDAYVLDNSGCVQHATKTFQVNATPASPTVTSSIPPDNLTGQTIVHVCGGSSVTLSIPATSLAIQWYVNVIGFGSTTVQNGTSNSITVSPCTTCENSVSYYAQITDGNGCVSYSNSMRVDYVPTAFNITVGSYSNPNPLVFYQGGSVSLVVQSPVNGYQYQWMNYGIDIPGATGTSYTAVQTGNYSARRVNPPYCTLTSNTMTVKVFPTPTLSPGGTFTCSPAHLAASSGTLWEWKNSAGSVISNAQAIDVNTDDTFYVRVQQQYNGVTIWSSPLSISTATPKGSVHSFPANGYLSSCNGTVQIETNSAYTYWTNPNGVAGQSVYVSSPGTYTASVMDNNGCWTGISYTVTSYPNPGGISASPSTNICKHAALLTAPGGGSNYSWSGPYGGTGSTLIATETGTFTCTFIDGAGCSQSRSINIIRSGTGCTNNRIASDTDDNSAVGIDKSDHPFGIFPNPATTEVLISLSSPALEDCPVAMYDMLGRLRQSEVIEKGLKEKYIRIQSLDPGIYIVNIRDNKRDRQRKLIVGMK